MKLHEHTELAAELRACRALATSLRNHLEAAETLAESIEGGDDDITEGFSLDIGVYAGDVGNIEDWLDLLPINEDGTAAAEGFGENEAPQP